MLLAHQPMLPTHAAGDLPGWAVHGRGAPSRCGSALCRCLQGHALGAEAGHAARGMVLAIQVSGSGSRSSNTRGQAYLACMYVWHMPCHAAAAAPPQAGPSTPGTLAGGRQQRGRRAPALRRPRTGGPGGGWCSAGVPCGRCRPQSSLPGAIECGNGGRRVTVGSGRETQEVEQALCQTVHGQATCWTRRAFQLNCSPLCRAGRRD